MTIALIFKFLFFFVGTFLHELAHYICALLVGRAEGFSVLPKVKGRMFVFGSVKSSTRFRILSSFVAAAPLIWWGVLLVMLIHFGVIRFSGQMPAVNFPLILDRITAFSSGDVLAGWFILQLLWAGKLSTTDLKNFFTGLFSVSGAVLLSSIAGLIYLFRNIL